MRTGRVLSQPDLLVADSGLPCDTFNVVACADFGPDNLDARIKSVIQSFQRRPFSWWLRPEDRPGNLSARLEAAGLSDVEIETARGSTLANAGSSSLRQLASPFAGSLRRKGLS
jgi:hypothetical protein